MKKNIAILLCVCVLLMLSTALGEGHYCPYCGTADQKYNFCTQCGVRQPVVCADCGWVASEDEDAVFCGNCGAKLTDITTTESVSFAECEPGDIVTFGSYEQDNNELNGKEPIEWIVLSIDGDSVQLLARYGLAVKQYDTTKKVGLTWKESELRAWLNSEFIAAAFNESETAQLCAEELGTVQEEQSASIKTTDLVYLLNCDAFFDLPEEYRIAESTTTVARQVGTPCFWWLRDGCSANMVGSIASFDATYETDWYSCIGFGESAVRPSISVALQ